MVLCIKKVEKESKMEKKRRIETNLWKDVAEIRLIMSTDRQTDKGIKISILLLFDMPKCTISHSNEFLPYTP